MSYTNGFQTLVQSMNGLLTFNDGAGTVIENGTIKTQSLSLNNIIANLPTVVVNLWSNFTTGTANLLTNLTSGTINLGNTTVSIVVGAITFVGNSIQTGLPLATLNLFSNYNGPSVNFLTGFITGTMNICTGLTSGTLNIGRGSNINIGSASSGLLLKLDGNGLSNQVFISPQAGASGTVKVGTNENSNQIGSVFIKDNVITSTGTGTVKIGTNININQIGNILITDNDISTSSGIIILRDIVRLAYETVGKAVPSFITFTSGFVGSAYFAYQDFKVGGNTFLGYDVRQYVETDGTRLDNGQGFFQTACKSNQFLFGAGSQLPSRALPIINALTMGYYNGTDNASYIAGGAPYGGIAFGGCGASNPIASTVYVQSGAIYPYYGLRLYTGGLSFDKGNLNSSFGGGRGSFIQTGKFTSIDPIPPGGSITTIVLFTSLFGSIPVVTLGPIGPIIPNTEITTLNYKIVNIFVGAVHVMIYNERAFYTPLGDYGFNWIAIGSY